MRTWHRSAMACTVAPDTSRTRSRRFRVGEAAYRSASASRQVTSSPPVSSTGSLPPAGHRRAASAQVAEEGLDAVPDLPAAAEAHPVAPDQPDEGVADVDGHEIGLDGALAPAQKHRLDVGLDAAQDGVVGEHRVPAREVEQGLGGPARPRVAGAVVLPAALPEHEDEVHRYLQVVPLGRAGRHALHPADGLRERPEPAPTGPGAGEQQVAWTARAQQALGL